MKQITRYYTVNNSNCQIRVYTKGKFDQYEYAVILFFDLPELSTDKLIEDTYKSALNDTYDTDTLYGICVTSKDGISRAIGIFPYDFILRVVDDNEKDLPVF